MGVLDREVPAEVRALASGSSDGVSEEVARHLRDEPWVLALTRAGWIAKGVVYGAIAWAAVGIGLQSSPSHDAEYTGIVALLADSPVGRMLLVVIALGLVLYVGFRILTVALIDENDLDAWAHRVAYMFSAVTYVFVGWTAGRAALVGVDGDEGSKVEQSSRLLLDTTGGRWLLGLGAIAAFAIAVYFAVKGVTRRFQRQICVDDISSPRTRTFIEWTGAAGWVGRALMVGSVSGFVMWAAWTADPGDARGLDRSLHRLAVGDYGRVVVLATAALLMAYAAYCIVSARYRSVTWKDDNSKESTT